MPFTNSERFDDHRNALTAADAGRRQTVLLAATPKLVQHGQHQSRARCAERVAERNRAAVDIGALTVKPKLTLDGEVLAGEGFVHFDEINLFELQAGSGERFLRSR